MERKQPTQIDGRQVFMMRIVNLMILGMAACPGLLTCASARNLPVTDAAQLQRAVEEAKPGDTILIAPGRYAMRLIFTAQNSGTENAPVVLRPRDGAGSVVIDSRETGADMTVKFTGASHIQLEGLDITGGGYHGVFFTEGAHHILLLKNRIYDNFTVQPLNSHAEVKGSGPRDNRPRRITLADNEIFHTTHPPGGNFQGIDCNFCDDFRIVENYIHDIRNPSETRHSRFDRGSCIQMKSASTSVVIERNRIANCHIGVVYGGEGRASPEHIGGIVRNNIITGAAEFGVAIVNVSGGKVMHNTFYGNRQSIAVFRDSRNPDSRNDVIVANNLLDTPLHQDNAQDSIRRQANPVVAPGDGAGVFRDPGAGDFRLFPGASAFIDAGVYTGNDEVQEDFAGTRRPLGGGPDIGAFEHSP